MTQTEGRLAVALHHIEPATFEHCRLIRDWLAGLGVRRATLLVIPAADLHPFYQRSPALAEWLRERRDQGDAIAQQGFVGGRIPAPTQPRDAIEHVRAGRRLMERAGLAPGGYHAPSLGHALGARQELIAGFDWWMAPGLWRLAGPRNASTLRVDVRPEDFERRPARIRALERTLRAEAARRRSVTFDELAAESHRLRPEAPRVLAR